MMTLVIYLFVAATVGNPTPAAYKYGTLAQCQAVQAALVASGQVLRASGCAPVTIEVVVE